MEKKTIQELIQEMSHRTVSAAEITAAREYERSLIPDDLVIPQTDQIFETIRPVPVTAMITYAAPVSDGVDCTLPIGTKLKIKAQTEEKPIVIAADPLSYAALEAEIIPQAIRRSPRYTGYFLYISTVEFREGLRQIVESNSP